MGVQLSPMVARLYEAIHLREPKAQNGGSVPNEATELFHSYHRSWQDSAHDNGYSVHYPGDRRRLWQPSGGVYASALDVTLPTDLMIKYTGRLHHYSVAHPRAFYTAGLREFAGTVNGTEVFAWDCTSHQRTYGWDDSHLWHIHLSINRRFVNSARILALAELFGP